MQNYNLFSEKSKNHDQFRLQAPPCQLSFVDIFCLHWQMHVVNKASLNNHFITLNFKIAFERPLKNVSATYISGHPDFKTIQNYNSFLKKLKKSIRRTILDHSSKKKHRKTSSEHHFWTPGGPKMAPKPPPEHPPEPSRGSLLPEACFR